MPILLERLKVPDEFVLTQEEITNTAVRYLTENGWTIPVESSVGGHDVKGEKMEWTAYLKCKGSRSKRQKEGMVYDNTQIRSNVADQIEKMMRIQEDAQTPSIFIMANPGVDRVRWVVSKLTGGLDKLDIIRMWIYPNGVVKWDIPPHLIYVAKSLGIEKN
ncbi:hypothetical protein [Domibacillus epiphyticus]|uniref:Restriction endonuclease type IV Mrr domain-containing protein n=1 Tax=Domibacillus epiphyticus TaxID=1714355 RepID=A0A1V2A7G0_9BACI|nr:hypothetical protein [Domibacillus epiphyticus]OMP66928.1 hypothetical protein BTO28_09990 [Domibacillus epiphyticus]